MMNEPSKTGGRAALSARAAFVVHLTTQRLNEPGILQGRVEHVLSGQSQRFGSAADLESFMRRVFTETSENPTQEITDQRRIPMQLSPKKVPMALLVAILLGASMAAATAEAQVTSLPINKCLSGKIQGVGKSLAARSSCFSKEAQKGIADPTCHQKASDKFTGGLDPTTGTFNKLQAKYQDSTPPCLTTTDQDSFEAAIAGYAASVPTLTGSGVGKCDAAKIKCVGKYVAAVAKCDAKAAATSGMIDSACTGKAVAKLANGAGGCLDKAALKTDCSYAGSQAAALQAAADAFLQDALCALAAGNSGCAAATPTVTPTGTPTETQTATPTSTPTSTPTATATETVCVPVFAPPALAAGTFIRFTRYYGDSDHYVGDVTVYNDQELNALSNSDPAIFDGSNFIDPAVCNSTAADLDFHWQITYPAIAAVTNPYTVAGITGYRRVRLEIGANTLLTQISPPVDFRLTVLSRATGLSTTVDILSQVSESSLTLNVFNSCKGQAMACPTCTCKIAAALPTTEPT